MKMVSTNVRISDSTLAEINQAAKLTEQNQADIIRLAIKIGMASLAKIGFDADAVVMAKVEELESADKARQPAPVAAKQPSRGFRPNSRNTK